MAEERKVEFAGGGVIKKCPNCGAQIEAFHVRCPVCGFAISGVEEGGSAAPDTHETRRELQRDARVCTATFSIFFMGIPNPGKRY